MSTTSSNEKPPQNLHDSVIDRLTDVGAKDQRAHERARHQIKERWEHAQLKERKEKAAAARAMGLKERTASRIGKKLTMESWDGDEPLSRPLPVPASPTIVAPAPAIHPEVMLADLVTFKTKKLARAPDADFEVLPPVRSVIALDDFGRDVEIDEPWEFISLAPESPAWKGLSYAQAAALTL